MATTQINDLKKTIAIRKIWHERCCYTMKSVWLAEALLNRQVSQKKGEI
ncbi:MAG: hypothetical protein JRJ86_01560 [Deltaproteobacteria bacterium]|nr:hypothetical protein [Deltaproteobacteria bacterium]MBW2116401.1 hypothetical protein [Deltaproteobacteria bacterium]MBW2345472.1 hypothetical protein [Deltaproteobacteria bacterium]